MTRGKTNKILKPEKSFHTVSFYLGIWYGVSYPALMTPDTSFRTTYEDLRYDGD